MSEESQALVTSERRGEIVIVRLNRPERRNALDAATWTALHEVLARLSDDAARAVILTGNGEAFCAGHDIRPDNPWNMEFAVAMQNGDRPAARQVIERLKRVADALAGLPMPTIAALNGAAYAGGAELALCCDLRVIDAAATICMSETRIGLIPDIGGTVRLTRLVGRARALDLIATARDVRADEALALGLVDRVAPAGKSLEVAVDLAALIAQNGPVAVRTVKRLIDALPAAADPMALETEGAVDVILSREPIEGIQAWLAKRPARWSSGQGAGSQDT